MAFYSDKHGVFRVNHPGALGGDGMTQFGRALQALGAAAPLTTGTRLQASEERGLRVPLGACSESPLAVNR